MRSPQDRLSGRSTAKCCSAVVLLLNNVVFFSICVVNFVGLQYYFEDQFGLLRFVKVVRDAGLLLILPISPYVAAEWNYGSPFFLHCYVISCNFKRFLGFPSH